MRRMRKPDNREPMVAVRNTSNGRPLRNDDPLKAARARGARIGKQLLAIEGPPLGAAEVSTLLHKSPVEVEELRGAGRLLAVEEAGTQVFPAWQFGESGLLAGFEEVMSDIRSLGPWAQLDFFLNANLRLDGVSPLDALRKGKLAEVRRAARNYGEQGAA